MSCEFNKEKNPNRFRVVSLFLNKINCQLAKKSYKLAKFNSVRINVFNEFI